MKNMKICAVICEFNPLHNGHEFLLKKAKELLPSSLLLCVMSGNFTQRGDYAILDKHTRAENAISCGADMVVQNPTMFATASSEIFALSNVKIINSFKNVSNIIFGSECGDIEKLKKCADFFLNEPPNYSALLKQFLDTGHNFNQSRLFALSELGKNDPVCNEIYEIIQNPNNILGIEYIKALKTINSKIEPITVKRESDHNTTTLSKFTSSSAIRTTVYQDNTYNCKDCVPKCVYDKLTNKNDLPDKDIFDNLVLYTLRTTPTNEMSEVFDVCEGLENRMKNQAIKSLTLGEYFDKVSTKRYQVARLKRIATQLLLKIYKKDVCQIYKLKQLPFIKVLSAKKEALKEIKCKSPLIVRNSETNKIKSPLTKRILEIEDNCEQVYALLCKKKETVPYIFEKTIIL